MVVDLHPDKTFLQKGGNPANDVRREPLVGEDVQKTCVIDMVEKALDVHGEEGGDQFFLPGCVDVVGEGESGVEAGGIGASTELVEGHELVFADVIVDTSCDDLLNEFA